MAGWVRQGTVLRIQGRSVRTRLDEDTLKRVAALTDAQYYNATNEAELRGVYENLSLVPGKLRETLAAGRREALLSRELALLNHEVQIAFDLESLRRRPRLLMGYSDVTALGMALQFLTIAVNFVIVAAVLFLVIKGMNTLTRKQEAAPKPAEPPADVKLPPATTSPFGIRPSE